MSGRPKRLARDLYSKPHPSHWSFPGCGSPHLGQMGASSETSVPHCRQGFIRFSQSLKRSGDYNSMRCRKVTNSEPATWEYAKRVGLELWSRFRSQQRYQFCSVRSERLPARSMASSRRMSSPLRDSSTRTRLAAKPIGAVEPSRGIESDRGGNLAVEITLSARYEAFAYVLGPGHAADERLVQELTGEGRAQGSAADLHQLKENGDLRQVRDHDSSF